MKGSAWWQDSVPSRLGEEYERAIIRALEEGYGIIDWTLVQHEELEYEIMRAPLAIGEPDDLVYLYGLSARTVDRIIQTLGGVALPTSALLDWRLQPRATFVGPNPQSSGARAMTKAAAYAHNVAVQRTPCAGMMAGWGKIYVQGNPRRRPGYACEYGWDVDLDSQWARDVVSVANATSTGYVVQAEQWAHEYAEFWDYSMGCVLVKEQMRYQGKDRSLSDVLCDPQLVGAVSVHGCASACASPSPSTALQLGSRGDLVQRWQQALQTAGYSLAPYGCDGVFGRGTAEQTRAYQQARGLVADGVVGPLTRATVGQAEQPMLALTSHEAQLKPYTAADRVRVYGTIPFTAAPTLADPEAIVIDPGWVRENIAKAYLPGSRRVQCHRLVLLSLQDLWNAWERADLLDLVLTLDGMWVPRFMRGSRSVLSAHAWGSAFDIDARWNPLGAVPAHEGEDGCVRALVPLAEEHGWFWGGHFLTRPDGMHFEYADA